MRKKELIHHEGVNPPPSVQCITVEFQQRLLALENAASLGMGIAPRSAELVNARAAARIAEFTEASSSPSSPLEEQRSRMPVLDLTDDTLGIGDAPQLQQISPAASSSCFCWSRTRIVDRALEEYAPEGAQRSQAGLGGTSFASGTMVSSLPGQVNYAEFM